MKTKLILLIGPDFMHDVTRDVRRKHARYIYFNDEVLGLAAAYTLHPDVVICQNRLNLLSAKYIKFKLRNALKNCRFFTVKNKIVRN